eukprot:TRINITY_DN3146_c0_g4_i1.p1 TRINITY_DN3146_c0_g4~~TRINITY_DN3146_c0_g4_i1.p1  ORF type:complete len:635 (+),score=167.28 TRINITY_DN3146_c0_g4_i1:188-2092(+)
MSEDARKAQRRKELEEKRKKLEEYRIKNQATASPTPAAASPTPLSEEPLAAVGSVNSFDALISAIDKLPVQKSNEAIAAVGAGSADPTQTTAPSSPFSFSDVPAKAAERTFPTLSIQNSLFEIDVPPKETIVYSKGTQTAPTAVHQDDRKENRETSDAANNATPSDTNKQSAQSAEEAAAAAAAAATVLVEISQNEKQAILESDQFKGFLTKASRVVERALSLSESFDIFVDYSKEDGAGETGQDRSSEVLLGQTLFDERWSKHRVVSSLSWSPKHPELLLTAYSANEVGSNDPDGVVLVWSALSMLKRPEFVFYCQSPVTTAFFPQFHPTTIIGGTYSGQIMLWDTRAKSTPMQKSAISTLSHTHPIYCAKVIGTQNANNLATISTDGKMCVWSLDNLSQPIEVLELYNKGKQSATKKFDKTYISATALTFPAGEVNTFLVGSEEGAIYSANRHGTKTGVQERYEGHYGPITGIDSHPASNVTNGIDFSDLFLTSSTDWTCMLWSKKSTKPIYSFEDSGDYVFDVAWSPIHPSLFADVDGRGTLKLWNLIDDTEVPIAKVDVCPEALNKIAWAADGKSLAVGNSSGTVHIYNIGDKIALPAADSWTRLEESLTKIQTQTQSLHATEETTDGAI